MKTWLALGTALLLVACGSTNDDHAARPELAAPVPLPECPDANYAVCDIRESACQARLGELAACLRQNDPISSVSIELMTPEAYLALLEQESSDEAGPTVLHFNRALALLSLAPEELATGAAGPPNIDSLLGLYRSTDKRIIVLDRGEPADTASIDATLLHEFIHALQDADYDLANWPDTEPTTFDSRLARNSVIEGEARFYEYRAAVPLLGLDVAKVDFPSALENHLAYTRSIVDESERPVRDSYRTFPYGFGAQLAFAAWTEGGPRGTDALWASPPTTTQQIMSQVLGIDTPQTNGVAIPAPVVTAALEPYGDDVLGAWGLGLLLSRQGLTNPDPQALAWRGDHFWVYSSNNNASTYFLWQFELASEQDATNLRRTFTNISGCDRGAAGARVFISCAVGASPSSELTVWGQDWLGGD